MKRLHGALALILALAALMLLMVPALAAQVDADEGGLTVEELEAWAAGLLTQARREKPLVSGPQAALTEDGYEVIYSFATLYLDTPELMGDSLLSAAVVTLPDVAGPRFTGVYDTQQQLLSAYANENPRLVGSRDFAVLYLSDNRPEEVLWARIQRDGQQITAIQYAAHELLEDGEYSDCGLVYSLEDGFVTALRAYGLSASITAEQLEETVAEVEETLGEDAYFAYPQSEIGTDLTPFSREDLVFSGLDFPSLTPEAAIIALGAFEAETWLQDDGGEWLRIIQWPQAEITFVYDAQKALLYVDSLAVTQRGLEGPRAVMVGDSFSSALMRFRHSEGEYDEEMAWEVLYGDGETPPFGVAQYEQASFTLRYAVSVQGQGFDTVTLHLIFMDGLMTELFLYTW